MEIKYVGNLNLDGIKEGALDEEYEVRHDSCFIHYCGSHQMYDTTEPGKVIQIVTDCSINLSDPRRKALRTKVK